MVADTDQLDDEASTAASDIWQAALLGDRDLALRGSLAARRVMCASVEYALLVRLPRRDAADGDPKAIKMRASCRGCGHQGGIVRIRGGQHVVHCAGCARYAYCAPRREVATW